MKKLLYVLLWAVLAAILHLFGNNVGTFAILVTSVVLPIVSGLALLVAVRLGRFEVEIRSSCLGVAYPAKGDVITCVLDVQRGRIASIFPISCTLACENRFTGEVETGIYIVPGGVFTVHTTHCGVLEVRVEEGRVYDPLGIFSRRVKTGPVLHIIIPPVGAPVDIPLYDTVPMLDSDEYATNKAGLDVSETYAIREYIPGDPIRSIHWKLSEKLDKTMVREFGLPIGNAVLLVLDTAGGESVSAAGWDATAELFFSVADVLVAEGKHTSLSWHSAERGGYITLETRTAEDVAAAVRECLHSVERAGEAFVPPAGFGGQVLVIAVGDFPIVHG